MRYDSDVEPVGWAEVRFENVIELIYRDSSICTPEDILGNDYLVVETDSVHLRDVHTRRNAYLVPTEFEMLKNASAPMKHYRLYFDDVAAIEVVATSSSSKMATDQPIHEDTS